ncbi:MAG TPA: hypothetical protein VD907_05120 [Verrucomicrobiae bacterium]|nr:hypothetical protein [Verrucomicrobiae bacterium]
MANPEQLIPSTEKNEQLPSAAQERSEQLKERFENLSTEEQLENRHAVAIEARKRAIQEAESAAKDQRSEKASDQMAEPSFLRITKADKKAAYNQALREVQTELRPTERTISKVIHNPVIEKASDVAGATIFRPNAVLAAGICGFILSGAAYVLARHFGYVLSGFETIGALIVGFIIGLLYDFLKVMITGKRK